MSLRCFSPPVFFVAVHCFSNIIVRAEGNSRDEYSACDNTRRMSAQRHVQGEEHDK
jgi:hypothetical protein